MTDTFSRDSEARFRGEPAIIKDRLKVYEPFLKALTTQGKSLGLDLGCGRGEWLQILSEAGLEASGVDLDDGMLDVARANGLAVDKKDALEALRETPDGSLAVISAFNLIEYLPFEVLTTLVVEARRALRPGGIIILETPNPRSPVVGFTNFHLDGTHVKPLPAPLLQFVIEYAGFSRSIILMLKGADQKDQTEAVHVLTEISMDYAVVAQVGGSESSALDAAFDRGLGVHQLSAGARSEKKMTAEHAEMKARADRMEKAMLTDIHSQREELIEHLANLEQRLTELISINRAKIEARMYELERVVEYHSVKLSNDGRGGDRFWFEKPFFRSSGRPVRSLRRLLFHSNGKPRGIFRGFVFRQDGSPRSPALEFFETPLKT